MHRFFVMGILFVFSIGNVFSQTEIDGKWYDDELSFFVISENIKRTGALEICIVNADKRCVENLMTGYEILVYNSGNEVIWKSLWTGQQMNMKFKKKIPEAHRVEIKARAPFVVNKLTQTRIYQKEPLSLTHIVE